MDYTELFVDSRNLPEPLTREEFYSYLRKYKEGDLKAREQLIEHNIRLVIDRVLNRFPNTPYEKKELISVGIIGLIKSVDNFNIETNFKFTPFATECIDNEIIMFLRANKKHRTTHSIYEITGRNNEEGTEETIEDNLEDKNADFVSEYEERVLYDEIRKIISDLPDRDREMVSLYFGFADNQKYSQQEIANMFNTTPVYVSTMISKIIKNIGRKQQNKTLVEEAEDISKGYKTSRKRVEKSPLMYEELRKIISDLPDRDREIVSMYFGLVDNRKYSQQKIADMFNIKRRDVSRIICKIVKNIGRNQQIKNLVEDTEDISEEWKSSRRRAPKSPQTIQARENCVHILEMFKTSSFREMLEPLTPQEALIMYLKLGYVEGKNFTTKEIAEILEIESKEVIETSKKAFSLYKENLNQFMEMTVDSAVRALNKR